MGPSNNAMVQINKACNIINKPSVTFSVQPQIKHYRKMKFTDSKNLP